MMQGVHDFLKNLSHFTLNKEFFIVFIAEMAKWKFVGWKVAFCYFQFFYSIQTSCEGGGSISQNKYTKI